ncbi:unnamed protein product [Ixodes persulcatus]
MSLLEERASDVPELKAWLKRRDNWLAPTIQNEILEILAHMVQRDIVDEIKRSPFYAIMADSTTDMSGLEQFTLCVRCVDPIVRLLSRSCSQACTIRQTPRQQRLLLLSRTFYSD